MLDKAALETILKNLADVDNHVEPIARRTSPDSDLNILAHAIHNITDDLTDFFNALV